MEDRTLVDMTDEMHRAFVAGGCDPECHTCRCKIAVGDTFGLVVAARYGDSKVEVMTCTVCAYRPLKQVDVHRARMEIDPVYKEDFEEQQRRETAFNKDRLRQQFGGRPGGAYLVDGRIVV